MPKNGSETVVESDLIGFGTNQIDGGDRYVYKLESRDPDCPSSVTPSQTPSFNAVPNSTTPDLSGSLQRPPTYPAAAPVNLPGLPPIAPEMMTVFINQYLIPFCANIAAALPTAPQALMLPQVQAPVPSPLVV